jgi:hypothetical protein
MFTSAGMGLDRTYGAAMSRPISNLIPDLSQTVFYKGRITKRGE